MGYPVCPNRIHSSGINGPWKSLFETTKSFLGDSHRLKLFLGVWESGEQYGPINYILWQLYIFGPFYAQIGRNMFKRPSRSPNF